MKTNTRELNKKTLTY
ncbi:unnamed protein product [Medioppia subpectinata]|uniref:Uncharacterized protein n=1 Tax=Medioppia subpectinata TaxID=1979941 RepID=A0A7R9QMT8_9ACAR|nr:unnamed protein product [Medioppia subpectinata]CAG2123022.1 unnamed protein product [Medioppia subpectinata]